MPKKLFKPGESGNPKGRPPLEKTFSDTARKLMAADEIDIEYTLNGSKKRIHLKSSKDMHHGIAAALISEGMSGNVQATNALIDRIEGKPVSKVEAEVSASINLVVSKDDENL